MVSVLQDFREDALHNSICALSLDMLLQAGQIDGIGSFRNCCFPVESMLCQLDEMNPMVHSTLETCTVCFPIHQLGSRRVPSVLGFDVAH
jgi:hypothetical protein